MPDTPTPSFHGDEAVAARLPNDDHRRDLCFVAVERTRMPMVIADARQRDVPIVLANRAFLQLSGYAPEEILGRNCRFLQGPDTDPAAIDAVRRAIAAVQEVTVELVNYRKDGSKFWNQLHISPIFDDHGTLLYFFASQLDITRQRAALSLEAAERRLLREVDHRANNALALVQGIVRLSRVTDAQAFAEAVQRRVGALARAHALLSQAEWHPVDIQRLIAAEVADVADRTTFGGPDAVVTPGHVQPLALVISEALANAIAHGALSAPAGRVCIEWRHDGDELVIEIGEHGGPPPPTVRPPGFGTTLMSTLVERQLRGSLAFAWAEAGLGTTVRFPHAGLAA